MTASLRLLIASAVLVGIAGCSQDNIINHADQSERAGLKLYNEGNYTDAAGAFRNAIRADPRQYKSYYYLGASLDATGQYQQAIQSYKSGLEVMHTTMEGKEDKPFRMRILDGAGAAIAKSSDRNSELDMLQKKATATQSPEDYLLMAKVYQYSGDADSAVDVYNRAALLAPDDFYIQRDCGLYLEQLGQAKRAETPLRKAYALNNKDEQVVAALRRIGVVPGPSIKDQKDLAKPVVPQGPIPQVDISKMKFGGGGNSMPAPTPTPAPAPAPVEQTPRD